jgi:hypothetical protein
LVYTNLAAEEKGSASPTYKGKFAVLCESNTRFGRKIIRFVKKGSRSSDKDTCDEGDEDSTEDGPVVFPFPLHVSEVRGAYEQTTGPTRGDTLRLPSFGSKLHLSLGKHDAQHETEPSLDSAITAVTVERLLATTLNTIAHERYRYVLIVASDVKDMLFLATLVRNHCPTSRLLLSSNELMLTHPDISADLRGSLVGSSYPLYSRNQQWSPPFEGKRQRLLFPGQWEQGYYNATIALLNHCDVKSLVEYGPPFPEGLPEGCVCRRMPPVWISIVGQGGLYPVKVYPAGEDGYDGYVFDPQEEPKRNAAFVPVHPGVWIVPGLALFLLLGYVGLAFLDVVWPWFALTDKSLAALRAANVPEEVLSTLNSLKDKEFLGRGCFLKELANCLGEVECARYRDLLLEHAWVREWSWFKLTNKSLAALRADKVPDGVLSKLNPLKDKEFLNREDFVGELANCLDKDERVRYQDLVLKHAWVREWLKLTDKSLAALRADKVPEGVLAKLNPLQEKRFLTHEDFLGELANRLDQDERHRYRDLLLKHAEVRDRWGQRRPDSGGGTMRDLFWPRLVILSDGPGIRRAQRFHLFVCLASVLVMYGYVTYIELIPPFDVLLHRKSSPVEMPKPWGWVAPVFLVVLPIVLFVCVVWARVLTWDRGLFRRLVRALTQALQKFLKAIVSLRRVFQTLRETILSPRFIVEHRFLLLTGFVLAILAAYLFGYGRYPKFFTQDERLFFFDRATNLANGVTPVVPVLLLGLGFYLWSYIHLRRLYLLDQHALDQPFPPLGSFSHLNSRHDEVAKDLRRPREALTGISAWVACVALCFLFCRLASYFVPSVEGVVTESLLLVALAVLSLLIVYGLLHLRKVWRSLRKLLQAIASLQLDRAFKRLPESVTALFGPYLSSQRGGSPECLERQREMQRALGENYVEVGARLKDVLGLTLQEKKDVLGPTPQEKADLEAALSQLAATTPAGPSLTDTARACSVLLERFRKCPPLAEKWLGQEGLEAHAPESPGGRIEKKISTEPPAGGPVTTVTESFMPADDDGPLRKWLARVQDFVALETVAYLSQFFVHLRNLFWFLGLAPLLMLFAVSSYTFQPQRIWLLLATFLVGLVAVIVIRTFFQIERDEVVSRVLKTTPDRLNFHWPFISHVLLFASPLVGILIAMSADLSDFAHAWLDPLLQLVK